MWEALLLRSCYRASRGKGSKHRPSEGPLLERLLQMSTVGSLLLPVRRTALAPALFPSRRRRREWPCALPALPGCWSLVFAQFCSDFEGDLWSSLEICIPYCGAALSPGWSSSCPASCSWEVMAQVFGCQLLTWETQTEM